MKNDTIGFVYFIKGGNLIKIGFSERPKDRFRSITTMSPVPLNLLGYVKARKSFERKLHKKFRPYRSHGEWFHYEGEVVRRINELLGEGV